MRYPKLAEDLGLRPGRRSGAKSVAKKLGIHRTSLWRVVKGKMNPESYIQLFAKCCGLNKAKLYLDIYRLTERDIAECYTNLLNDHDPQALDPWRKKIEASRKLRKAGDKQLALYFLKGPYDLHHHLVEEESPPVAYRELFLETLRQILRIYKWTADICSLPIMANNVLDDLKSIGLHWNLGTAEQAIIHLEIGETYRLSRYFERAGHFLELAWKNRKYVKIPRDRLYISRGLLLAQANGGIGSIAEFERTRDDLEELLETVDKSALEPEHAHAGWDGLSTALIARRGIKDNQRKKSRDYFERAKKEFARAKELHVIDIYSDVRIVRNESIVEYVFGSCQRALELAQRLRVLGTELGIPRPAEEVARLMQSSRAS